MVWSMSSVMTGAGRRQVAVVVVQEEEPLQLGARWHFTEGPVGTGLLVSQKSHPHSRTVASSRTRHRHADAARTRRTGRHSSERAMSRKP